MPPREDVVLIVEDDPGVLRLQKKHLERAGFRVVTAGTADEALARVRHGDLDLVVLDNRLPDDRTGLGLYEDMKAAGFPLPAIMVTGFSDETTAIQALRSGIRDFVSKTVEYLDYLPEAAARVLHQARLERKLAESEALLAAVIGSAHDAILTTDAERRIRLFNGAAEKMFRCAADQAIGQPLERFVELENVSAVEKEGGATRLRVGSRGFRADGAEFPMEATVAQAAVDARAIYTVVARDVTAREEAEARLREQAAILDQANDAIIVEDLKDGVRYWNRGAERLYGWRAAEADGRNIAELLYRGGTEERLAPLHVLRHSDEWKGELRQFTRAGTSLTVESHWSLLRSEDGQPRARLIINTDITGKKRLEEQLLRTQRLESIGTMAGGIAHDLNNVLTPVAIGLELLRQSLPDSDRLALLGSLGSNVHRGVGIVRQLLLFARGRSGEREPLALGSLIRETEQLLRWALPKTIALEISAPTELWPILADPTQISQVLTNLCVNARDAMPDGGTLHVAANNIRVDKIVANTHVGVKPGPFVRMLVRDNGAGMTANIVERIFDPFFTTKEVGKGTGLGLSTVQGIVKSHGGFLVVRSEVGVGSEFAVYLPAAEAVPSVESGVSQAGKPAGRGETILVVDDELPICMVARVMLEAFGYHVLSANHGKEALEVYHSRRDEIRAVITDTMMPHMDGPTLIHELRILSPTLPIIAASGMAHDHSPLAIVGGERVIQLSKPYNASQLLQVLQQVLRPE